MATASSPLFGIQSEIMSFLNQRKPVVIRPAGRLRRALYNFPLHRMQMRRFCTY